MAVPGFSVSDLIQALGQVKVVYDAFFNEYTNTAAQVKDLRDEIDQFRINLQNHKDIVEQAGLDYTGYAAVERTLNSCRRFLDEYKDVLDRRRRKSVAGAWKTTKFAFDQEEVSRLRAQIDRHKSDLGLYSLNLVLGHVYRGKERTSPITSSTPVPIAGQSSNTISPPPTPPLLGSPLLPQDRFSPRSSRLQSGVPSSQRPMPPLFEDPAAPITSLRTLTSNQSLTAIRLPSFEESPAIQSVPRTSQYGLSIPGLVLPQSALPYRVAEVYFENKKVELKRKAAGRDGPSGREMVILDEAGSLRFRHRIKSARNGPCYPYTWHKKWRNDHNALEIGFKGTSPDAHSISFKGAPASFAIPKYIFAEKSDFEDFQSELRGKLLEDTYEIRQIRSASSSKNGEATDQHLKIWKDHSTHEYSVSFYASAISKPHHMEFPFAMFEQQIGSEEGFEVCLYLNFIGHGEQKKSRTFSKAFSRSPTERSTSSASTTVPGVFTRNNTGIASSASSITTTSNSRMSVASSQSDSGNPQAERSKTSDPLEIHAKTMKYLRIEFSDEEETTRFKQTYARLYQKEISRPVDFVMNWQLNTAQQRPEGVVSTSPSGTPFTMSPVLHPIRNTTSNQER